MADAAAPETPQVHIERLRSFTRDLELSIRLEAKGYETRVVTMEEVRRWLDAALASPTDEAIRPIAIPEEEVNGVPSIGYFSRSIVLGRLRDRVAQRADELAKNPRLKPQMNAHDWVVDEAYVAMKNWATLRDPKKHRPDELLDPVDESEVARWLKPSRAVIAPKKK